MEFYTEPARRTPLADKTDVLVAGGGPAGFSAAVTAARLGAGTVLIERSGDVGGMATIGLMSHWTGSTRGGIYEEILARSSMDGRISATIDPERLKTVMLDMLEESGVRLRLYTLACDPMMEADRITGVVTESKSGRQVISTSII